MEEVARRRFGNFDHGFFKRLIFRETELGTRKFFYEMAYRRAGDESVIHWHREEVPALLRKSVESMGGSGKVLDIGCGTGVNSVFMAQQGLDVTAIDFVPEALEFARRRAEKFEVDVDFIRADVTKFETADKYDLILDSGCFHGFDDRIRLLYRKKILSWMPNQAQYVLIHFGKRQTFDFGLFGPRAKKKSEIEQFFAPELKLEDFLPETGGKPLFQYRFTRNHAS